MDEEVKYRLDRMKYYIVDAFSDTLFKGNPAGICLVENELDVQTMQNIAAENNLSETAFVMKHQGVYFLRWFTPKMEINLCGHATLGSAFVIANFVDTEAKEIRFETKSGTLIVKKHEDIYELDFPSRKPRQTIITSQMEQTIGASILEAYSFEEDLLLVLKDENHVQNVNPDFELVKSLAGHAVTITAQGNTVDFVSRFFAPNAGVPEDPVTGSAHTMLIPFWADRFGKHKMIAKQLSKRGGTLYCENCGNRVKMSGKAALYLQGEIFVL